MKIVKNRWLLGCILLGLAVASGPVWAQEEAEAEKPDKGAYRPEVVENPEVKLLDEEGAGKLYQVDSLLVCVMEGTPEEMGYQHGRLLADKIRHIMEEGYMTKALWARGYTREYVEAQSARMEQFIPERIKAELRGLVKGMKAAGYEGATYENALIGVTQSEILHYDPGAPPNCSNFACWGQWTPDGRLLHGRNLDWNILGDAQSDAVVLVWRPKGGWPFMMVSWAGAAGSVTGMSSKGLTIGEMTSTSPDSSFDGQPLFVIMRRILDEAQDLEQATAIMKKGPRTTGWNFVVGDGKVPDARAMEVDAKRCTVFAPLDEKEGPATGHWAMEDAVRRTNHPIGEEQLMLLAEVYGPRFNIDIENVQQALPLLKMQNTWKRYDWLGKQIQAHPKGVDVDQCLYMLATPPVGNMATLHSCVMDPANQVAYVAIAGSHPPMTASRTPYVKLDLKPWFK